MSGKLGKFVCHFDYSNFQWNVFKIADKGEEYVCSFLGNEPDKAFDFCASANKMVDDVYGKQLSHLDELAKKNLADVLNAGAETGADDVATN